MFSLRCNGGSLKPAATRAATGDCAAYGREFMGLQANAGVVRHPGAGPGRRSHLKLMRRAAAAAKGRSATTASDMPASIASGVPTGSPSAPRRTVSAPKISVGT